MTISNASGKVVGRSIYEILSIPERIAGWNDFVTGTWQEFTNGVEQRRYESGRQIAATVQAMLRKIGFIGPLPRIKGGQQIIKLLGVDVAREVWNSLKDFFLTSQTPRS